MKANTYDLKQLLLKKAGIRMFEMSFENTCDVIWVFEEGDGVVSKTGFTRSYDDLNKLHFVWGHLTIWSVCLLF